MIDIKNSKNCTFGGKTYDFTGVHAVLSSSAEIQKVTCLETGKDLTEEYKLKYRKPKTKISKDMFDKFVAINGFDFADNIFEVENEN